MTLGEYPDAVPADYLIPPSTFDSDYDIEHFEDVSPALGLDVICSAGGAVMEDFDGDGHLDILASSWAPRDQIRYFRNVGDGTFADLTQQVGLEEPLLAMGCNFGDLDSDGYLDFYIGTGDPNMVTLVPNRMFRNAGGRHFQDVTTSGGFGHLQKGHAVAFGDLDHDGDQEVFAVIGGNYSGDVYQNVLFRNPGHGNHWLKLKLEGRRSNRAAMGARIEGGRQQRRRDSQHLSHCIQRGQLRVFEHAAGDRPGPGDIDSEARSPLARQRRETGFSRCADGQDALHTRGGSGFYGTRVRAVRTRVGHCVDAARPPLTLPFSTPSPRASPVASSFTY